MNTMSDEERKKCNRCKVNLLLKDYKLKRDGLYSKSCFKCLDGFVKSNKIKKEKNKDKFKCKECDYSFTIKSNLQRHIKAVHDKIKDFECDQCNYKCSSNSKLTIHIKAVHLKIKDNICEYENCEFKSSTTGDLQIHIKSVHLKIKDNICEYENCNAKFSINRDLQRHIKQVHDKIKDFECENCGYKCLENSTLQRHIKSVHDKIKDFECEHCDYKCSENGNLQRHIKICTGKEYISIGEFEVRECLREMNIHFQHNTSYVIKDVNLLKWDFILYKDDKVQAFIEYDGKQHFIPIRFSYSTSLERAEENLRTCQKRDKIKDDFCKENNYPLLRIPYTKFGNIPQLITEFCVEHLDWGDE